MKQHGLFRFEGIAQEFVEGKLGRLFGGRLEALDVARQLSRVMEESANHRNGQATFVVALHPKDYRYLTAMNPNLADDIAEAAWQFGKYSDEGQFEKPKIKVTNDQSIRRHKVKITAEILSSSDRKGGSTKIIGRRQSVSSPLAAIKNLDAYLIIQGRRHIALDKPLITIGRRTENDIVLDMPTVSRLHAQIRWRFGRFVLYDVSTRGKTMVNGYPTSEHVLRAGDVIALSDALLIYGEGQESQTRFPDKDVDEGTRTLIRPSNPK